MLGGTTGVALGGIAAAGGMDVFVGVGATGVFVGVGGTAVAAGGVCASPGATSVGVDVDGTTITGVCVGPGVGKAQGASGIRVNKTLPSTSPLPPASETEAVTSTVPV